MMRGSNAALREPNAAAEAAIEEDERRAARDSWRAAGGSSRRPLKSFRTDAEKREMREAHAELLREAIDAACADADGLGRFVEACLLNPHLTALNAALAAYQTPGRIVDTAQGWSRQGYRIRKGETAAGRLTGRGFWPRAYFTAEQANAGDLAGCEVPEPPESTLAALSAALRANLDKGTKAKEALAELAEAVR